MRQSLPAYKMLKCYKEQGPDKIELFFYGKRPCVEQRLLGGRPIEIADMIIEVPIRIEEYGAAQGPPQQLQVLRHEQKKRGNNRERQHEKQRGADAPYAAAVEIHERKTDCVCLAQDYTRDEESRNHEENIDTNKSARQLAKATMKKEDQQNRDGPQTINIRPVYCLGADHGRRFSGMIV